MSSLGLSMKAWDAVNGRMGRCYADIDNSTEEMIYLKDIDVKIEKEKKQIPVLGYPGSKNKATGWKGTGTATVYYVTSRFRKLLLEYMHTGKDTYFDLYIENEDPSSETGSQSVWIKNVNLDGGSLAKLDVNNTELDEEISFTFENAELLDDFDQIYGENN